MESAALRSRSSNNRGRLRNVQLLGEQLGGGVLSGGELLAGRHRAAATACTQTGRDAACLHAHRCVPGSNRVLDGAPPAKATDVAPPTGSTGESPRSRTVICTDSCVSPARMALSRPPLGSDLSLDAARTSRIRRRRTRRARPSATDRSSPPRSRPRTAHDPASPTAGSAWASAVGRSGRRQARGRGTTRGSAARAAASSGTAAAAARAARLSSKAPPSPRARSALPPKSTANAARIGKNASMPARTCWSSGWVIAVSPAIGIGMATAILARSSAVPIQAQAKPMTAMSTIRIGVHPAS